MRYYTYNEFIQDIKKLHNNVKEENFDAILAIARGGVTISHFLASKLNSRNLFTINSIHYEDSKKLENIKIFNIPNLENFKKVLIVDDIIDSGDTMQAIQELLLGKFSNTKFKTLSIFQKESAKLKANFYAQTANEWIEFFWEKF